MSARQATREATYLIISLWSTQFLLIFSFRFYNFVIIYLLVALLTTVAFLTIDFHGWSLVPLSSLFMFTSESITLGRLPPRLVDPVATLVTLPPRSVFSRSPWLSPGIVMLVSEAFDFALPRRKAFMFWFLSQRLRSILVTFQLPSGIKWQAARNLVTDSLWSLWKLF